MSISVKSTDGLCRKFAKVPVKVLEKVASFDKYPLPAQLHSKRHRASLSQWRPKFRQASFTTAIQEMCAYNIILTSPSVQYYSFATFRNAFTSSPVPFHFSSIRPSVHLFFDSYQSPTFLIFKFFFFAFFWDKRLSHIFLTNWTQT